MATSRKPKRKRTAKTTRRTRPEPVTVEAPAEPQQPNEPAAKPGMFASLGDGFKSLLGSKAPEPQPGPEPTNQSADSLPASSESTDAPGPIPAAKLDTIPDTIGGETDAAGQGSGEELDTTMPVLKVEFAEGVLDKFFGLLQKKYGDRWDVSPLETRMIADPLVTILNNLIGRLNTTMPGVLAGYFEGHPEYYALLLALGVVVGPRLFEQLTAEDEQKAEPADNKTERKPEPRKQAQPQPRNVPGIPVPAFNGTIG